MKTRKFESSQQTDEFLATIGLGIPNTRPVTTRSAAPGRGTRGGARQRPLRQPEMLDGVVQLHPNGFGFLSHARATGTIESYFVRPGLTRGLLSGDKVRFVPAEQSPMDQARDSRSAHQVVSIDRDSSVLLCEMHENGILVPDEPCTVPVQADNLVDFSPKRGDVLAVRVPAFSGAPGHDAIVGQVQRNLGQRTRPDFVLDYAQSKFGFDAVIPEDLLAQDPTATAAVQLLEKISGGDSQVLSKIPYVTIDGESTLDFDDAVHVQRLADGWLVHVAISDVAKFVTPGSPLDQWAAKRSTSVYLPGRKLPMLPEALSQGACSLLQGRPRFAVTQALRLNEDGSLREVSFTREMIQVSGQLSYQQVADFMEKGQPVLSGIAGIDLVDQQAVGKNVEALAELYPILAARRLAKGLMDFEEPDPMPEQVDGQWRLSWADRTVAHKLIEELMIMANQAAAVHLVKRYGAGLFRHQPAPDATAWAELRSWAKGKGLELPEVPDIKAMTAIVTQQKGADAQAAAVMKLRSAMRPAKYVATQADVPGGHFSLALDWYTQFTSPIRRYPDLLVHRLVTAPEGFTLTAEAFDELVTKVAKCTSQAHAAKMAERFVLDRLKLATVMAAVEAKPDEAFHGRVIRQNQRGAKVLLSGWQTMAWLGAPSLLQAGFTWEREAWLAPLSAGATPLEEGSSVTVTVTGLSLERAAYPELQVRMHAVENDKSLEMV